MAEAVKINRIERRRLEFRDKITNAALKLFEEQGVAETSVASIITEADIAHKTFFNHFPSKGHLLRYIASTFSGNAYDMFREGFKKHSDPRKRLEYCLINIAKTLDTVSPHYKELLNLYLISGTASGDMQRQQKEQFSAVINQIITDAEAEGQLRESCSIETYTDVTVGLCVATLLNWSLEEDFSILDKMQQVLVFLNDSLFSH